MNFQHRSCRSFSHRDKFLQFPIIPTVSKKTIRILARASPAVLNLGQALLSISSTIIVTIIVLVRRRACISQADPTVPIRAGIIPTFFRKAIRIVSRAPNAVSYLGQASLSIFRLFAPVCTALTRRCTFVIHTNPVVIICTAISPTIS
jgi:hypothetical protein